jgi:hypothetical protein
MTRVGLRDGRSERDDHHADDEREPTAAGRQGPAGPNGMLEDVVTDDRARQ